MNKEILIKAAAVASLCIAALANVYFWAERNVPNPPKEPDPIGQQAWDALEIGVLVQPRNTTWVTTGHNVVSVVKAEQIGVACDESYYEAGAAAALFEDAGVAPTDDACTDTVFETIVVPENGKPSLRCSLPPDQDLRVDVMMPDRRYALFTYMGGKPSQSGRVVNNGECPFHTQLVLPMEAFTNDICVSDNVLAQDAVLRQMREVAGSFGPPSLPEHASPD